MLQAAGSGTAWMVVAVISRVFLHFRVRVDECEGQSHRERGRGRESVRIPTASCSVTFLVYTDRSGARWFCGFVFDPVVLDSTHRRQQLSGRSGLKQPPSGPVVGAAKSKLAIFPGTARHWKPRTDQQGENLELNWRCCAGRVSKESSKRPWWMWLLEGEICHSTSRHGRSVADETSFITPRALGPWGSYKLYESKGRKMKHHIQW